MNITHPIPLGTNITATKRDCPCRGGNLITISGSIQKIISNQSGTWYYLSTGQTVNSNDVSGIQT